MPKRSYCVVYCESGTAKWARTEPMEKERAIVRQRELEQESWCSRAMTAKHAESVAIGLPEGLPR